MADVFGQLFTKADGDRDFGDVLFQVEVPTALLRKLLDQGEDYLMFNIVNNRPVVLGKGRKSLHNEHNVKFSEDLVFHVYSTDRIKELLDKGGSKTTVIEKRQDVMTITNGNMLLEMSSYCPPMCS